MYKAIKRSFKKRIRRQEEWMDLQKGQRTMRKVYAVIALVILSGVGTDAYTRAYPSKIEIDNPRHWDAGKAAESVQPQEAQPKDEAKDGVVVEGDIESRIKELFPEDPETALAIAKAESKLNPNVVGDKHLEFWKDGILYGHSCGIFQIRALPGRPNCETLTNVETNLAMARKLYEKAGWQPWGAYTNKSYLKWL